MKTDNRSERVRALRKKAMQLALRPGVYIMKDSEGKIIYIGKAKQLKNRVSQYFGSQENHTAKVRSMVASVHDFDYIVCDSEYEALVLECSLIKLHKPKYNILLKDDKGYHYIKISNEEYPRITAEKQIKDDGAQYLGPYTSGYAVKQSVDEACTIFRLPTCRRHFPRDIGKGRSCLNYSIKRCMGVCRGKVSKAVYDEAVAQAIVFLKGGTKESIKTLTERMQEYAEKYEFEKAARMRDRITALQKMSDRQKVVMAKVDEQDVFAISRSAGELCLAVLRFFGGRLVDSEQFVVPDQLTPEAARSELIRQFYSIRERIPGRIAVDGEVEDISLCEQWLSEKAGRAVHIVIPQKGEQARLVEMCASNASEHIANRRGIKGSQTAALDQLAKLLGLSAPPEYIEAYDISNTMGEDNVAGMVVFKNGLPLKSAYRRFRINGFAGQDDYGSMREVITRRIDEYHKSKTEEGFGQLPSLILLDGGEGHVACVRPLIEASGLDIPVFGMVKDSKHRTRAIAAGGHEIAISANRAAFTLVSNIQEEVHRFAISYHRASKSKKVKGSSLTQIEGIGEKRAAALLRHFRTISAIKQASVEELAAAPGMTKTAAERVYTHFHTEQ